MRADRPSWAPPPITMPGPASNSRRRVVMRMICSPFESYFLGVLGHLAAQPEDPGGTLQHREKDDGADEDLRRRALDENPPVPVADRQRAPQRHFHPVAEHDGEEQ